MSVGLILGLIAAAGGIGGLVALWYTRRSTKIAEAEHEQRQRERQARAKLDVAVRCSNYKQRDDGVYVVDATQAWALFEITITNSGDRNAGRGTIEVDVPLSISDYGLRWTDAGGGEIPDRQERATPVATEGRNVLTGKLEGVGRDHPEKLYAKGMAAVPGEYAIQVRVRAEHADAETADFDFRIERGVA